MSWQCHCIFFSRFNRAGFEDNIQGQELKNGKFTNLKILIFAQKSRPRGMYCFLVRGRLAMMPFNFL